VPKTTTCPECGHSNLYSSGDVSAGGGYAPNHLPGLGTFFSAAQFTVVVCKDCGLTRFFAAAEALSKIPQSDKWRKV
jgi:predicted nucleic-acid-binding Zn-ribbon protein